MGCGCQCTCPSNNDYSGQSLLNQRSVSSSNLAKKPSLNNGWTTDCYDDGDFMLCMS